MTTPVKAITLTTDKRRIRQLEKKLAEYRRRRSEFKAPEQEMDTLCKIAVLERLLRDGQVFVEALAEELARYYTAAFDRASFDEACDVISDYNQTGGVSVGGGSGLPDVT
jgi:hypothetical protein